LWHGGSPSGKCWESTPDGREGYEQIFTRWGWSVYILDRPRHGRAGMSRASVTVDNAASAYSAATAHLGEQASFVTYRFGVWPTFFDNVQFSRDPAALEDVYWTQTDDTGPGDSLAGPGNRDVSVQAVSALFDRVGRAVLVTHSASGVDGWLTALAYPNVRGIVAYEPGINCCRISLPCPVGASSAASRS
jgi:pimeloyl-ACP methyl ester carboxylesterase